MVLQVSSTGGEHSRCANETPKSLNKLTANNDTPFLNQKGSSISRIFKSQT